MTKTVNGIDGSHLKSYIERIERLEVDKKAIAEDIKEVFSEAKAFGFDTKIMKEVIKDRKLGKDKLYERQTMVDIYFNALGQGEMFEVDEMGRV